MHIRGSFLFSTLCIIPVLVSNIAITVNGDPTGPCDIFGSGGTPCVAAHSLTRRLYGNFTGALYQVRRTSDNTTKDIMVLPNGYADGPSQDSFCTDNTCIVQIIYDQSPNLNHLGIAPPAERYKNYTGVNATKYPITMNGNKVYGAHFEGGMGYRNNTAQNVPKGNNPEVIYMVTSGLYYNDKCCHDYGNAETDSRDHGPGTMECVYFGNLEFDRRKGNGTGPWIMADLESGLYPSNSSFNPNNIPMPYDFVTGMVKGNSIDNFVLKAGDATSPAPLLKMYDGPRPSGSSGNYYPMRKQGAIALGSGGDGSAGSVGLFFEGVMTAGFSTDDVDVAVQNNIAQAGYGK